MPTTTQRREQQVTTTKIRSVSGEALTLRAATLLLAAKAEIDPRTARRALERGVAAIHGEVVRERAARAMNELGLTPGEHRAAWGKR